VNALTFKEPLINSVAIAAYWKLLRWRLPTMRRFYFKRRQMVLPLLGGEGWDEGERKLSYLWGYQRKERIPPK
jgi:hypothetical protein